MNKWVTEVFVEQPLALPRSAENSLETISTESAQRWCFFVLFLLSAHIETFSVFCMKVVFLTVKLEAFTSTLIHIYNNSYSCPTFFIEILNGHMYDVQLGNNSSHLGNTVFKRPCVAEAVLKTALPILFQTVRATEMKFWKNVHPPPWITCHLSCVRCHMSGVTCQVLHIRCHVSCVTCHVSGFFWEGGVT